MLSGRIRAFATVGGLFAGIVGLGAYAIVSLAPVAEYAPPPRGTFLLDPGPGAAPAPPPDRGFAAAEPPSASPPRARAAALPARPLRPAPEPVQDPRQEQGKEQGKEQGQSGESAGPGEDAPAVPPPEPRRPHRVAVVPPPAAILPRPPAPQPAAPPRPAPDPRLANVLTPSEIRKLKLSLRLTPEQAPHWPPVEAVLAEIGAQQMTLARAGQNTADAFSTQTSMRIYWAAKPLLGLMREDQKAQIRLRARAMGLASVASYL